MDRNKLHPYCFNTLLPVPMMSNLKTFKTNGCFDKLLSSYSRGCNL